MLLQYASVVNIPAGTIQEVEVVRDFDESHAAFDQSPREHTSLTEFATVTSTQISRFFVELEAAIEFRAAKFQTLVDCFFVFTHTSIVARSLRISKVRKKRLSSCLSSECDTFRARQSRRPLTGVREIKIAVSGTQKSRAARDIWITDQDVGRCSISGSTAFVRHQGTE